MKLLSIDLEDWFHILDHPQTAYPEQWLGFESRIEKNARRILNILDEADVSVTWFVLGWVAEKYPALVREISLKHEIACHSNKHELVYKQSRHGFKADCLEAKARLEDVVSKPVSVYRAAGFSITPECTWAFEVLLECGFTTDSSVFPASRNHGGFPSFPSASPCRIELSNGILKEFPVSVSSLFGKKIVNAGGGYFRLLPYSLIRKMLNDSVYVMSYFHPRDFDPGQPLLKSLPLKRKLMSYYGLKGAEKKFVALLKDFEWTDLRNADKLTDWNNVPLVKI